MLIEPRRVAAVLLALAARVAAAQDEFEIQVYDSQTAASGEAGLETHANAHRLAGAPDELHVTFEPHYGAADWLEAGGYFQTATTTTGDLAFAGAKLRLKARWPHPVWGGDFGLALNGELSVVPSRFEPNVYGSELRPVVDVTAGRLYAAVNPIVSTDLHGALAGHPQLEPCAKLAVRLGGAISLGAEAYAALGPVDDLGREHVTRAFAVADITGSRWDLNVGAGYGWGSGDHPIAKVIFGIHPGH